MTQPYSTSCTFNTLVLKFMDPILLIIADVPIMVASSTGLSAAVIRTNLAWPINKLKPIKI